MLIESRTIVSAAAALALVGGAVWGSVFMFSPAAHSSGGSVEVTQVEEASWSVEIKEMAPTAESTKTAAAR
jgi:hypothetical protein